MSEEWKCPECAAPVPEKRRRGPHRSACRRSANAKYIYKDNDRKHPYHLAACRECGTEALMKVKGAGFCSLSCSQRGERNSSVTQDPDGYVAQHRRVSQARGAARSHRCLCTERASHWANLTGDYADIYDYTPMCPRCHKRYDNARRSMEE